jgi:hypothetical protein
MKLAIDVELTPAQVAEAFCSLNDERQAEFFIECARIASTWGDPAFSQWRAVGRHLRDCTCSNDAARELVLDIASPLTEG